MEKMVAYCGIICTECDAYLATQKNDLNLKKELAAKWSKEFNAEIKPEDINCDGCLSINGRHISYCFECGIRKCGIKRGLENCAYCGDLDCESLNKFHEMAPDAGKNIEEIRKNIKSKNQP
jgi:hypothetical protein